MLSVSCPRCSYKMKAPDELAGKTAKCGKCGHKFVIEAPSIRDGDLRSIRDTAFAPPNERKSRVPIAAAALVAGFAVLSVGLWVAFELGRRQTAPLAAAPQPGGDSQQLVPVAPLAAPPKHQPDLQSAVIRQPLLAPRPAQHQEAKTAPKVVDVPKPTPPGKPGGAQNPKPGAIVQQPPVGNQKPVDPVANSIPAAVPKAQAKDADLHVLETAANHSPTAKDALALYNHFAVTRMLTASQQEKFKAALQIWEDRARQNLARLGDKWVAEADVARAHEEAAQLFRQAYEMTKVLNFEEARKTLERASRVDPNSIAADFTLGILNSITPTSFRSPKTAEKHFQIVLRRLPGYVPALNNLAIAQIRQERYAEALRNLRDAADRSPTTEEVTQNLGRFVSEAHAGRIRPRKTILSEATKLYAKVVTSKEGTPSELKFGWRFIPLVSPKGERENLSSIQTPEASSESFVAQGSGFVIEPHYVLTCRHVVDDQMLGRADKIELLDPADPAHKRRFAATCIDVGSDDDLCLLRCDQLNAPNIPLADRVPPRGTEVVLIGFPGGSWFGLGLKTTRGIVTALPGDVARLGGSSKWSDSSRSLWYDAASSHGASGGAVCDDRGNVVAIHALGYQPGNDPSNAKYAGGVPAPNARAFIRTALPAFAHPPATGPSLKWADVDAKVSPSIVLIVVGYRKVAMVMNPRGGGGASRASHASHVDIYDDHVCSACNGRCRMPCRAPGCQHGYIHGEALVNNRINIGSQRMPIMADNITSTPTKQPCPTCHGTGYVRCPYCSNGIDPTLR
jgi:S1-C subfamily serine protease